MPNHITNKLTIIGTEDQVSQVLEFLKNDELGIGTIDFNKITPMPKWVYGSTPEIMGITSKDEAKWGEDNTSLGWARRNWRTKWNAYEQPDKRNGGNALYFKTAWNGVPGLIQKIAWIFPEVTIEYSFADEDYGSRNCGIYRFKENEVLEETHYLSSSKEAYELSFDLVNGGEIPEWYVFDEETNTYKSIEN